TAGDGSLSRISPQIAAGAGVVTTRAHVRTVVTEWGVAELFGRSLRERAAALIAIAHPDHRDRLRSEARERGLA
ncbi:MAG TPA: acetyl-CoA hydrolase/transferase C-terminal domain-containing protein, partial [Candidatus Limnocylindrales bacterium]|nr:acetyl-CoA hydrolase/transferase C-terminal domain-containing protein [Candidatus Limnocylindrales bacterium]